MVSSINFRANVPAQTFPGHTMDPNPMLQLTPDFQTKSQYGFTQSGKAAGKKKGGFIQKFAKLAGIAVAAGGVLVGLKHFGKLDVDFKPIRETMEKAWKGLKSQAPDEFKEIPAEASAIFSQIKTKLGSLGDEFNEVKDQIGKFAQENRMKITLGSIADKISFWKK